MLFHALVGGFNHVENDGVRQWGSDDIPYMKWKIIQSCLKPPTRLDIVGMMSKKHDNCGILEEFWDLNDLASDNGTQTPHRIFVGD